MIPDDGLRPAELVGRGGEWHGLLFDNPRTGYELALTWSFSFGYQPVERDGGATTPTLTIDWVPCGRRSWTALAGCRAASQFAAPVEASIYFFEHHRYAEAEVRVLEQRGLEVCVDATVHGDLDHLGLESLRAGQWLRFGGIYVQPSSMPADVAAAAALLAEFTDPAGLAGTRTGHNYRFDPAGAGPPRPV